MASFGRWYEEKKNEENGDSTSNSWFDEQLLPLFNTDNLQPISWSSMKTSMESQMPKKILGMGYQQRFKVRQKRTFDGLRGTTAVLAVVRRMANRSPFHSIIYSFCLQVFCGLIFLSALFFALAFFVGMPMIAVRPQKFALSFTCGSLTFMGSFGIMKGPAEHLMSMIQPDRLAFTFLYLTSMFLTLYCTFSFGGASGYLLVVASSGAQLVALLWYLISFLPGGASGLKYVFAAMLHLLKPVVLVCARIQAACFTRCLGWITGHSTSG